jgi:hypothetical protein
MARVRAEDRTMPKSYLPAVYSSRRRWTEADARTVLAALDASGLSVVAFAERQALDAQRLDFSKRRVEAAVEEVTAPPAFVEVVSHRSLEHVEMLRSGRIVRVSESIDADALEQDPAC